MIRPTTPWHAAAYALFAEHALRAGLLPFREAAAARDVGDSWRPGARRRMRGAWASLLIGAIARAKIAWAASFHRRPASAGCLRHAGVHAGAV